MVYNFLQNFHLKRYYDEPNHEYNVISTVVFRLENNYKNMGAYYKQIFNMTNNFNQNFPDNFYLRLYFDNSIIKKSDNELINKEIDETWIPLLKKLKKMPFVQLCWYKHTDFSLNNIFHAGIFGTIIRFLPIFDYSFNKNIKTVIISDIDVSPEYMNYTKNSIKYTLKHNLNFFFRTSFCKGVAGYHQTSSGIADTWLRIMAGTVIVNNYKFPKSILNNFFEQIYTKNYDENLQKFIKMDVFNKHSHKANKDPVFRYGLDEFFAMYLLKDIINNKIKFGYLSKKDIDAPIYFYYYKNNEFSDNKPIYKELLIKLLGSHYDNKKTLQQNYMFFEKTMYIFYSLKKPSHIHKNLATNTFNFFQEIKDKNLYDYYGFSKQEVTCVLFQKNKIDLYNNPNKEYYINN
jgi:hypothetical protein